MRAVQDFRADALVIALGVDTFEGDPISKFKLASADYRQVGRDLATLGLPAVFTMEAVMRWKKSAPTSPTSWKATGVASP